MAKRYRLAVINSHPIQYFAPFYRRISATRDIDITVYYCSRQSLEAGFVDPGFGKEVVWDVPLLDGYRYKFLANLGGDRGARGFFSLVNLSVIGELWREKYDAVLIHGHGHATNLLALLTAKLARTRVFMRGETHLLLRRHPLKRALRKPLMALLYRLCDACLYIGTRNREFYEVHGVPSHKLFFVPYAVDNQSFSDAAFKARPKREALRARLGIPLEMPVILYASKLMRRKRPRDLLLAFSRLRQRGVRAALVYVGDGEERASLMRDAVASGFAPDVFFVGFINQSNLPEYYAIADAFVLPSEDEPWGLIINEAMCAALAVVSTSEVGAAPDLVIHEETGFVYPVGDVDSLSSHLERLTRDVEQGRRMGARAHDRIMTWSYDKCIEGIRSALVNT